MKLINKIWILIVLTLFTSVGINAEIINGIACKVNDSVITIHEFETAYRAALRKSAMMGLKKPSKKEVMDSLINKLLIEEEAEKRGIVVTDKEINEIIDRIKKENRLSDEQFRKELSREGLTLDELRENYKIEILKNRLINQLIMDKGYEVSDEEIKIFYNDPNNERLFILPAIVVLSEIFIGVPENLDFKGQLELKKKVEDIYNKARQSGSFEELVREYSEDKASKENGGRIGSFNYRQLAGWIGPDNASLVFSMNEGDVVPPLRTREGYYIFKIESKRDERMLTLKEAYNQIKSYLLKKKGEEIFKDWLSNKRKNSYIQYVIEME